MKKWVVLAILLIATTVGAVDVTPPVGLIDINKIGYTYYQTIPIRIAAGDALSGIDAMCITFHPLDPCLTWEPYVPNKNVTLPAGAGMKSVCVTVRDGAGNIGTTSCDTIELRVK
jgi:hypothetical protein